MSWHVSSGKPVPNHITAKLGWLTSEHRLTAEGIAAEIGCGLTGEDVVRLWSEFGYERPVLPRGYRWVRFSMAAKHRTLIAAEARERGLEMPDLMGLVLSTVCRDDLFGAILDD